MRMTLILIQGDLEDAAKLKQTLVLFSAATGLAINFHKSTVTPMHIQREALQDMMQILQCQEGSFPQVYLGLPLSPHKIAVADCLPLISNCDRHLSGWRASLLNRAGRLTLSTAVLSSIPLHYMSAMSIPKTVIQAGHRPASSCFLLDR